MTRTSLCQLVACCIDAKVTQIFAHRSKQASAHRGRNGRQVLAQAANAHIAQAGVEQVDGPKVATICDAFIASATHMLVRIGAAISETPGAERSAAKFAGPARRNRLVCCTAQCKAPVEAHESCAATRAFGRQDVLLHM